MAYSSMTWFEHGLHPLILHVPTPTVDYLGVYKSTELLLLLKEEFNLAEGRNE